MRSLGDSYGVSLAPQQQLQDDTTDDEDDMRDMINRESLDPSSDYHTWKGILAPSFSSLAPTQRSRVLEMACLHIADVEAEADHFQHVLCVQERGGERGGEVGGTRKDVRRSIGRVSFAFCFVSLRFRSALLHCVCQRLRGRLVWSSPLCLVACFLCLVACFLCLVSRNACATDCVGRCIGSSSLGLVALCRCFLCLLLVLR